MRKLPRFAAIALVVAATPALAEPAARDLFGAVPAATTSLAPAVIGSYAKGCLAGGQMLPPEGSHWQAVRLSRNRNWGHPAMVRFLTGFAAKASAATGWPGLLVGDIAQPRGGPMRSGHASHQLGIDADVWLSPMPPRVLSRQEREDLEPVNLVADNGLDVVPGRWTPAHLALIRLAASQPEVERVFVNAAIKKALCRDATGDRSWLTRVRPLWGHNYHMHIRMACPPGEEACERQAAPPAGDGCGKDLAWWFTEEALHPKPGKPRPPMTMAQLPAACAQVLTAK
ncbi:penicillin-insensitive murein endopeptidase [uncultured Alsobacter sp.]|uniref:penicillin-insensitive murein endopeptidase n=1 Tax=uncultured Alsobacter sp. TaxID=1748258 RepID=UPI0025CFADBC|nr:penicillin-insensitive murein endopeptidase [uncultured Alsobacter sp.]